jgi:hypothetical protein
VFGQGQDFIDNFKADKFAYRHTENLYFPFSSRDEWELDTFLTQTNLSMKVIDGFLSLGLVSRYQSSTFPLFTSKLPGKETWPLFPECKVTPSFCRTSPQRTQVGLTRG